MSKTAPKPLSGISELAARFDYFVLDQFGVLHDGAAPYPGAVETLLRLKAAGKRSLLLSGSEGDRHDLDHYRRLLEPAAARGVRCICTNPDKVMLTAAGPRFGAGRIAELYAELGGAVEWIGKPFPRIYQAALELLGNPPPERVVCVGDSIEHDIAGGRTAGLKTALVATGILETSTVMERERLFAEHGATPGFLLPAFVW